MAYSFIHRQIGWLIAFQFNYTVLLQIINAFRKGKCVINLNKFQYPQFYFLHLIFFM